MTAILLPTLKLVIDYYQLTKWFLKCSPLPSVRITLTNIDGKFTPMMTVVFEIMHDVFIRDWVVNDASCTALDNVLNRWCMCGRPMWWMTLHHSYILGLMLSHPHSPSPHHNVRYETMHCVSRNNCEQEFSALCFDCYNRFRMFSDIMKLPML